MMSLTSGNNNNNNNISWRRRFAAVTATVLLAATVGFVALSSGEQPSQSTTATSVSNPQHSRKLGAPTAECETQCKDPTFKDLGYFKGDDLLKADVMLQRLQKARTSYKQRLQQDYGKDMYLQIFEPTVEVMDPQTNKTKRQQVSVGREKIFRDPSMLATYHNQDVSQLPAEGPAWSRMVRKFQMKLLQIRLGILEERTNVKAICLDECSRQGDGNDESRRLATPQASNGLYTEFVWATGGHSASAGHGNLYRESYTANFGRAMQPIMAAIGLEFTARNYAMGGMDCAEELALCMNAVYGRDLDAISWDFGMTDGHDLWKMTMYAYRAAGISRIDSKSSPGNIQHRPAFFAIHQNEMNNVVVGELSKLGMTAMAWDTHYLQDNIIAAIPDMMGKSDQDIAKIPAYIQYMKCDGKIESGDPGCGDHKFNQSTCWPRKATTSWHPGWKYHALVGNLMAVTFLDVVEDALLGLIALDKETVVPENESMDDAKKRILKQLQGLDIAEKKDYDRIFNSPLPEPLMPHIDKYWQAENGEHLTDMDKEAFFKQPSFCHTGLLPSESRFKGLLTENFTVTGTILDQNYDVGISSKIIFSQENPPARQQREPVVITNPRPGKEDEFVLVSDESNHHDCDPGSMLDYKDFFLLSSLEGWRTLTIPNNSEKKYYREFDAKKAKGYILVCLARCNWGKCQAGDLHNYFGWKRPAPRKNEEPISEDVIKKMGQLEMTINNVPVTEVSDMYAHCFALKNKKGHVWEANADGRYEIRAQIKGAAEYAYLQFSSFIVV